MSSERNTIIFGAGFSGKVYGAFSARDHSNVFGTTRAAEKTAELRAAGIKPLLFNANQISTELEDAISIATDVVVSIAPGASGDLVLHKLTTQLSRAPNLEWIGYLSTVGVYGNHDGAWVDEATPCKPVSDRSVWRLAAEEQWQKFAEVRGLSLSILRLSGIYGPGRNALKNIVDGKARRLVKPGQVFNRIHVHDIAGSLDLLSSKRAGGTFNVTDDLPAPPQDVVEYAALVTKIDPPDEIDFETATLSPMARSFYGENKRVSNAKLKQAGYVFEFPDYRIALDKMWNDENWR